ncbi:protein slit [Plakobranchus ocellatus]|uniref:Protein slit n=1 Tax=Plakobranchus ocellatus TaxID=259542 RepID=A0AAV4ALV7_9GAST|nr:protein slit [Plakobranchus ocellatus]
MERTILLITIHVVLTLSLEMEAGCVGSHCHALGNKSDSLIRRTRWISDSPEHCLCDHFDNVHCEGDGLLEIPSGLRAWNRIVSLTITHTNITVVRTGVFSSLKYLLFFKLTHNRIRTIERGAFQGMAKLHMLALSHNFIKDIPKDVFNGADTPELRLLYLNGNLLKTVKSESFCGMTKLSEINLQYNQIMSISKDAFKGLPQLARLNVSHNQLTSADWLTQNCRVRYYKTCLDYGCWITAKIHGYVIGYWIIFLVLKRRRHHADPLEWFCKHRISAYDTYSGLESTLQPPRPPPTQKSTEDQPPHPPPKQESTEDQPPHPPPTQESTEDQPPHPPPTQESTENQPPHLHQHRNRRWKRIDGKSASTFSTNTRIDGKSASTSPPTQESTMETSPSGKGGQNHESNYTQAPSGSGHPQPTVVIISACTGAVSILLLAGLLGYWWRKRSTLR